MKMNQIENNTLMECCVCVLHTHYRGRYRIQYVCNVSSNVKETRSNEMYEKLHHHNNTRATKTSANLCTLHVHG